GSVGPGTETDIRAEGTLSDHQGAGLHHQGKPQPLQGNHGPQGKQQVGMDHHFVDLGRSVGSVHHAYNQLKVFLFWMNWNYWEEKNGVVLRNLASRRSRPGWIQGQRPPRFRQVKSRYSPKA